MKAYFSFQNREIVKYDRQSTNPCSFVPWRMANVKCRKRKMSFENAMLVQCLIIDEWMISRWESIHPSTSMALIMHIPWLCTFEKKGRFIGLILWISYGWVHCGAVAQCHFYDKILCTVEWSTNIHGIGCYFRSSTVTDVCSVPNNFCKTDDSCSYKQILAT
jgi:hypothetical protein